MNELLTTLYFIVGGLLAAVVITLAILGDIGSRRIIRGKSINGKTPTPEIIAASLVFRKHIWEFYVWAVAHFFLWPISVPFAATLNAVKNRKVKKSV